MTNLLAGIKTADKVEEVKDVLASGKFEKVESGVYDATIKYAYLQAASTGSVGLHLEFELEGGTLMKETMYITNAQGENFYVDKKDAKKKHLLGGFVTADAIALLAAQKSIVDLKPEDRIIKLRDFDLQKDVPTTVSMLVELVDKPVRLGIIKKIKDKTTKTDEIGANGKPVYKPTGETMVLNEVDKVFHLTNNMTVPELRAGATEAEFITSWKDKWEGKTYDSSKGTKGGAGGGTTTKKSTASLFI